MLRVHPSRVFDLERDPPAHQTDREHGNAQEDLRNQCVIAQRKSLGTVGHLPDQIDRHQHNPQRGQRMAGRTLAQGGAEGVGREARSVRQW